MAPASSEQPSPTKSRSANCLAESAWSGLAACFLSWPQWPPASTSTVRGTVCHADTEVPGPCLVLASPWLSLSFGHSARPPCDTCPVAHRSLITLPSPLCALCPWRDLAATMLLPLLGGTLGGVPDSLRVFSLSAVHSTQLSLSWVTSVGGDGRTSSWSDCPLPLLGQRQRSAGAVQRRAPRQRVGGHPSSPPVTLPGPSWTGLGWAVSHRAAMRLQPVRVCGGGGPLGSRVAAGAGTPACGPSVAWASSQHGGRLPAVAF